MKEIDTRIMVYHDLQMKLTRRIAHKHKLHYKEYIVLDALNICDGRKVTELVEYVEMNEGKVQPVLDTLEKKKYVSIKHDHVFMNDNAKKEYKKIKSEIKKEEEQFIDQIGVDTYNQTLSILDRIIFDMNEHLNA